MNSKVLVKNKLTLVILARNSLRIPLNSYFWQLNMRIKHLFLVISILLCQTFGNVFAQHSKGQAIEGKAVGYDSGYVISFRDNFIVTLVNETKTNTMQSSFRTKTNDYSLNYKTNKINTWGIGIDYKWLTFEFTSQMPWYTPNPQYGSVQNAGFGFGITGRRLAFRNFYEFSKGYYLENTDNWLKDYTTLNNRYYTRPDIETFTYYANVNYIFNNRHFSNNASLWQLERQNTKAGTLVGGLSYIFNSFYADSSIIPTTGIDSFPRSNNTYFGLNCFGINLGYMGTLPFGKKKKWFLTTAIIPGISRQWGEIIVENLGVKQTGKLLGFQSEFRFGFGYNGDNWYIGSVFKSYSNLNVVDGEEPFSISNSFGRFYIGYRFNPPKIKNEKVNKFMKMIKL